MYTSTDMTGSQATALLRKYAETVASHEAARSEYRRTDSTEDMARLNDIENERWDMETLLRTFLSIGRTHRSLPEPAREILMPGRATGGFDANLKACTDASVRGMLNDDDDDDDNDDNNKTDDVVPMDSTVLTDDDLISLVASIGRDARAFARREAV